MLFFSYLRPYNNYKLQYRSTKCLFVGYTDLHKGYKCLSPSGRLYIADIVHFNVDEFPYDIIFPSVPISVSSSPPGFAPFFSDPIPPVVN